MAGLTFDDGPDVDPTTPLEGLFVEWVDATRSRKAATTVSGYLTDVNIVAGQLLDLLGRDVPVVDRAQVPELMETADRDTVRHLDAKVVAPATYMSLRRRTRILQLRDLDPRTLGRALDQLGVTRAASSQQRMTAAWGSFCGLMVRRGLLAANPVDHPAVERPTTGKRQPHPLSYPEVERLFDILVVPDPNARPSNRWPVRDLALGATLLSTGIRRSEAATVPRGGFNTDQAPRLSVHGKGNKDRTIPVHDETAPLVLDYLDDRAERFGLARADDPLFVRANGTPFSLSALNDLVERWFVRAAIPRRPGASVHALRHTFATMAIESGTSIKELQVLMGHESIATTQQYVDLVGSGLEDAVTAHHTRTMLRRLRQATD